MRPGSKAREPADLGTDDELLAFAGQYLLDNRISHNLWVENLINTLVRTHVKTVRLDVLLLQLL